MHYLVAQQIASQLLQVAGPYKNAQCTRRTNLAGCEPFSGVDSGATAYRRTHGNEDSVTVVKHMPRVERSLQPTIAVITSQYHEKLAVDAVMTNKQTFVRYATVGEC